MEKNQEEKKTYTFDKNFYDDREVIFSGAPFYHQGLRLRRVFHLNTDHTWSCDVEIMPKRKPHFHNDEYDGDETTDAEN